MRALTICLCLVSSFCFAGEEFEIIAEGFSPDGKYFAYTEVGGDWHEQAIFSILDTQTKQKVYGPLIFDLCEIRGDDYDNAVCDQYDDDLRDSELGWDTRKELINQYVRSKVLLQAKPQIEKYNTTSPPITLNTSEGGTTLSFRDTLDIESNGHQRTVTLKEEHLPIGSKDDEYLSKFNLYLQRYIKRDPTGEPLLLFSYEEKGVWEYSYSIEGVIANQYDGSSDFEKSYIFIVNRYSPGFEGQNVEQILFSLRGWLPN
jgi:predicted secreted protein